jgi:hypothetical protein
MGSRSRFAYFLFVCVQPFAKLNSKAFFDALDQGADEDDS